MKICSLQPATGPGFPGEVRRVDYESAVDGRRDWALLRPGANRGLWIVVIHGHGSQGNQLFTHEDIRKTWLPRFLATGAGLLTPNLRGNAWMGPAAAADLHALLAWLRAEHGLRQTIFSSGSMGGTSNLIYGVLHPEDVGGIVARGAASDPASYHDWCLPQRDKGILQQIAQAIRESYGGAPGDAPAVYDRHSALRHADTLTMPVCLSHGGADTVIPVSQSRALAERLNGRAHFSYKEIPGGNHDSPLRETGDFDRVLKTVRGE